MKNNEVIPPASLIWIYTDALAQRLDAATWLQTTKELREIGWRVVLYTEGPYEQDEINGIAVRSVPKPSIYLIRQAIHHFRIFRDMAGLWWEADIILFHQMSVPWLIPMSLIRRIVGKPVPLLIMDTRTAPMVPKDLATPRDRLFTLFMNSMNRLANKYVDGQTAITERMAEFMEIPADELLGIWPSGVDPVDFAAASTNREWPQGEEALKLIYVGVLQRERNLLSLCRAVGEANKQGMPTELTLIGDGSEKANLERFASQSDGHVRVLEPVPHEEIPDYLAQAHIGVLPFPNQVQFHVSSPIKLFEYMASGLAVLATRIVCHTDVVQDGDFVIWAEDSSEEALLGAIKQAWEHRETLAYYGSRAAKAVNNWTWKASANKLDRALNKGLVVRENMHEFDLEILDESGQ
jgi:glycosyltransferase involved in cell wall biosynthesis